MIFQEVHASAHCTFLFTLANTILTSETAATIPGKALSADKAPIRDEWPDAVLVS